MQAYWLPTIEIPKKDVAMKLFEPYEIRVQTCGGELRYVEGYSNTFVTW